MTFEFAPTIPSWATHIIHDLAAFKRGPVPVAEFVPLELPDDAYFEYAFKDARGEFHPDPSNHEAHNPWYDFARSVFGPSYRAGAYNFHRGADEPQGNMLRGRFDSALLGQRRRYLVYTPPGIDPREPLPCVYVHDGLGFLYYGQLPQVVDAMLAAKAIAPVHLVLIPPEKREIEYPHNERYQRFVIEELVPHVEVNYAACDGRRIALGASLGGLASTLLAWRSPETFGTIASLSGAFLTAPESPRDHHQGREWMREQVQTSKRRPIRFVLHTGSLEWLHDANHHLAEALSDRGYELEYQVRAAGHNWVNWRDSLGELLRHAIGSA